MVDGKRRKGRDRSWDDRKGGERGRRGKMPNGVKSYLEDTQTVKNIK